MPGMENLHCARHNQWRGVTIFSQDGHNEERGVFLPAKFRIRSSECAYAKLFSLIAKRSTRKTFGICFSFVDGRVYYLDTPRRSP